MKIIFYTAALLAGGSLAFEGAIAGQLGTVIGELESSYYIFMMGTILLGLITLFFGKGNLSNIFKAPKWNLTGGLLGTVYLTILVISIPFVGIGVSMVSVIVGQMITSMVIEHFGWLGSGKITISKERIAAIVCMGAALFFIF
ncbi:DMT family transporter [Metabacillus sp. KIGAM252]|uniref:DMT family transporter n=1 Tax=Metabacillus flavus TaxID=2823519 RepID=A0ABS5LDH3_9BACI|nr:DMT family transporter [Metabacillus flavus]MBS2968464.1 DMT family transporter [Metabacillus flavus]